MPDQRYESYSKGTDFIQKYIFPGGHLPSVSKILSVTANNTKLNLLHMEDFTEHYAKTLNIWHKTLMKKSKRLKSLVLMNTLQECGECICVIVKLLF